MGTLTGQPLFSANIETTKKLIDIMMEFLVKYGIQALGGVIILLLGFLIARIWCSQGDYWDLLFDINSKVFSEMKKNDIQIPFPQREVRILNEK